MPDPAFYLLVFAFANLTAALCYLAIAIKRIVGAALFRLFSEILDKAAEAVR